MNKLLVCFLLTPILAFANQTPLFNIAPQGSLPTTVSPTGTASAKYTVTNNAPYLLQNLGLNYQPAGQTPIGVTQNTGTTNTPATCANPFTLLAGASCTLDLTINGADLEGAGAMGGPEVCFISDTPSRCSVPNAGNQLNVALLTRGLPSLVAGAQGASLSEPLLVQSTDAGQTWSQPTLPVLPSSAFFFPNCNIDLCVIVFEGSSIGIIYSLDQAQTWIYPSSLVLGGPGGTACTQGGLGMCFVFANDHVSGLLSSFQYTAANPSWTEVTLDLTGGIPSGAACGADLCVAVGEVISSPFAPFISQIQNPGDALSNWALVSTFTNGPLPSIAGIERVTCDGDLCVGWGVNLINNDSFVVRTTDAGNTWEFIDLSPITYGGQSISCNEATSICAVLTADITTTELHLLSSLDAGATWTDVTPLALQLTSTQGQVSCSSALCVVSVYDTSGSGTSYVYQSIQSVSAGAWLPSTIPGFISSNIFNTSECHVDFCIVAGTASFAGSVPGAPLLAQTMNAGTTWAIYNLTQIPSFPTQGFFLGIYDELATLGLQTEMDYFRMKGFNR